MPYNRIFDEEKWEKVNKENKEIIKDYIEELRSQKKKDGTVKQYNNDLRIVAIYVLDNCSNKVFTELGRKDFRRFVLWLTDELKVSNARANRMMSAVRTLLSYLEDDDDYDDYNINAAAKIKGLPKEEVREIVFLPDEVIMNLYKKFMNEKRYKEATLLAILYESGCRKNEILQVRRDSIKEDGNASNEVIGKRGKKFKVVYLDYTKKAFKKYDKERGEDKCEALFISGKGETARPATTGTLYDWVVNWRIDLLEMTGTEYNINVHSLRHAYINNLLNGTHTIICKEMNLGPIPLEKIKMLAHHESSDTTLHYAENNEDKEIENLLGIKL